MYITNMYKYEKNGIVYVGGNVPEDATILETMDILNAEEGYDLQNIIIKENIGNSIWLKDGDSENNYIEIKHQENN